MSRYLCTKCARKHIAQAIILLNESKLGYPNHLWLAVGHLAEAEAEIEVKYHDIAARIREERLQVVEGVDREGVLLDIISELTELSDKNKEKCDYWR